MPTRRELLSSMILAAAACALTLLVSRPIRGGEASAPNISPPDALLEVYCPTRIRITINGQTTTATGRYRVFRVPGWHSWLMQPVTIDAKLHPPGRGCGPERGFQPEPVQLRPGERRVVVIYKSDFARCEALPPCPTARDCKPVLPPQPVSPGKPPPPNPS